MSRGRLSRAGSLDNVYLNASELADLILQHGAVFRGRSKADDSCQQCGKTPDSGDLAQIEVQKPQPEYYQIGIGRCEQILRAALRVRYYATDDPALKQRIEDYEKRLKIPKTEEIILLGGL